MYYAHEWVHAVEFVKCTLRVSSVKSIHIISVVNYTKYSISHRNSRVSDVVYTTATIMYSVSHSRHYNF